MHGKRAGIVVAALALACASGCAATRPLAVHPEAGADQNTLGPERHAVGGYVLRSGENVRFWGYVEAHGDTLRFVKPMKKSRNLELDQVEVVRNVPRDSVVMIQEAYTSVGRSIMLGLGIGLFALATVGLSMASNLSIWGN